MGITTLAPSVDVVGGKVVAYVGSDSDEYGEVFVEFHADGGRLL